MFNEHSLNFIKTDVILVWQVCVVECVCVCVCVCVWLQKTAVCICMTSQRTSQWPLMEKKKRFYYYMCGRADLQRVSPTTHVKCVCLAAAGRLLQVLRMNILMQYVKVCILKKSSTQKEMKNKRWLYIRNIYLRNSLKSSRICLFVNIYIHGTLCVCVWQHWNVAFHSVNHIKPNIKLFLSSRERRTGWMLFSFIVFVDVFYQS